MKKKCFNGMKAVVISMLMSLVSLAYADVAYNEQILTGNGGASVSLSGEWAAVGAYHPTDDTSCYVTMYRLDHTTMQWSEHSELGAAGGNCNGNKGFGAAISLSGTELAIGLVDYDAPGDKDIGAFSVYAYDSAQDSWELLVGPVLADDTQAFSGFGTALSIQNGILIVGAPTYDGTDRRDNGKVYLYERPPGTFTTLLPTVTVESDQNDSLFGSSVTGDAQEVVVGAPGYDQGGFNNNGAGFVYAYNSATPSLDPIRQIHGTADDEALGVQISKNDHMALITGNSATYGFHYVSGSWHMDLTLESTGAGDVSIHGNFGAAAIKGSSVNIYPNIHNSYFVEIKPASVASEYGEDISLSQNQLLVSEFDAVQARVYEIPCSYGDGLVENEWAMVSIPCKISGQTVGSIFGDDGLGTYDTNWMVYEQNVSNYSGKSVDAIKLVESSPIVQGKSYWIIADTNSTWKVDSTASTTRTDLNITVIPDTNIIAGVYAIGLPKADQNVSGDIYAKVMLGNTFPRSFEWVNVQYYSTTDGNVTLDDAHTSLYMHSTAYIYDSSIANGQPYIAITDTPGVGSKTIAANEGFWIKMLENAESGDRLLIPFEK